MDRFYSLCLQGDIRSAMEYLRTAQPQTKEIIELEKCYRERFFSQYFEESIPIEDNWIRDVIATYQHYFRTVLTNSQSLVEAELALSNHLARYLRSKHLSNIDEVENGLAMIFEEKGYYFLGGVTPPFRGPYIWSRMESLQFDVEIPFALQTVNVKMMSDFILESWIGFATFGKKSVGGWAKADGLYCNAKCYKDLEGDDFQISYLKHEAQHLYDYEQFPFLEPMELEYRAKLVELIYKKNHSSLYKFLNEAKNDPRFPHPYASYLIVRNISKLIFNDAYESNKDIWAEKEYREISSAATDLFEKNEKKLWG